MLKIYKILHCQTGKFYLNIYDFFELVDYDDRDFESEYTTVGGWCTDMLEKFQYRVLLCVDFEILSFTEGAL